MKTTANDIAAVARALIDKYNGKQSANGNLSCRCPFHDDRHRSAAYNTQTGAFVCYVPGCQASGNHHISFATLAETVGVRLEAVPPAPRQQRRIVATFDYHDAKGVLVQQVVRYEPKGFAQRIPHQGGWKWGAAKPQVPYKLPALLTALQNGAVVYVVEGEKHVDALARLGVVATTCAMGAGKWTQDHTQYFANTRSPVVVLPDNDSPGRQHAHSVAEQLSAAGVSVYTLDLPGLPPKGDVLDWLSALPQDTDAAAALETLRTTKAQRWQRAQPSSPLPPQPNAANADEELLARERRVLGRYLLTPELYDQHPMQPHEFWALSHQMVMKAFIDARAQGEATVATVVNALRAAKQIETVGGIGAVQFLPGNAADAAQVELDIALLQEGAFVRRLQHTASRLATLAADPDLTLAERRQRSEQMFGDLFNVPSSTTRLRHVQDLLADFTAGVEKAVMGGVKQLRTALPSLDRLVRAEPSRLVVVAARPGVGKSVFLLNLARGICAANNARVAFYSLEMNRDQVLRRAASAYGNLDTTRIGAQDMQDAEWDAFFAALTQLGRHNLYFNDSTSVSVADVRRECTRLKRTQGLDAIIIDYLGLLQRPALQNEAQALGRVARELKLLAMNLDCVVVVAAQLNRSAEQINLNTDDGRLLAALRDSGEIEEHADIVMFLERPHRLNAQANPRDLVVRVLKNRDGATGRVTLDVNLAQAVVHERSRTHDIASME